MIHVAQVGYATPTNEGNTLYAMFIYNMSEADHVEYDDVARRVTFFTYDEEVWREEDVNLDKMYEEWEKDYAR